MPLLTKSCSCEATIEAEDEEAFADVFLAHVRDAHPDWTFPDVAVRNYGAALLRLTGDAERLEALGAVEIHPVTEERIADWTAFFDHDGFVGKPEWAACYCTEPHVLSRISDPPTDDDRTWQRNRETAQGLLREGRAFGYLAYVDGRAAGWVNASKRSAYALFRMEDAGEGPDDGDVVGVSCFVIAPPFRRHGLAGLLLDRVLADAPSRGVTWVEGYPFVSAPGDGGSDFRGPRSLYEARGFEAVEARERYTVMRRRA